MPNPQTAQVAIYCPIIVKLITNTLLHQITLFVLSDNILTFIIPSIVSTLVKKSECSCFNLIHEVTKHTVGAANVYHSSQCSYSGTYQEFGARQTASREQKASPVRQQT